jgi:hypothetical protein
LLHIILLFLDELNVYKLLIINDLGVPRAACWGGGAGRVLRGFSASLRSHRAAFGGAPLHPLTQSAGRTMLRLARGIEADAPFFFS